MLGREVNAFTGSDMFREKNKFSAQIAHWSRGRDQYFPHSGTSSPSLHTLVVPECPKMDRTQDEMLVDILIRVIKRERRRRTDRAPRRGSRNKRNSVNACQTIWRFMNS